jgi:DNA-binding response OmpR family regulator
MSADAPVVLIVEPHRDSADMYAEMLTLTGFHTVLADDGQHALTLFRQLRPDVLVTEVALPALSGLELTRRVREDDHDVAVVVLSSHVFRAAQHQACLAGSDAFLVKPCSPETLAAEIRRVLVARRFIHAQARARIRAEYMEMPGMRLRVEQVQRLCGVDRGISRFVLDALVRETFLVVNRDGTYVRAAAGGGPDVQSVHVAAVSPHAG